MSRLRGTACCGLQQLGGFDHPGPKLVERGGQRPTHVRPQQGPTGDRERRPDLEARLAAGLEDDRVVSLSGEGTGRMTAARLAEERHSDPFVGVPNTKAHGRAEVARTGDHVPD